MSPPVVGLGEAEGATLCTQLLVKTIICAPVHRKVPVPLHTYTCVVSTHPPVHVLGRFHSQALFVLSLGGSRELIQGPKSVSCGESDPSGLLMFLPGLRAHRSSAVFGFDRSAPTALPGTSLGGCRDLRGL